MAGVKRYLITGGRGYIGQNMYYCGDWLKEETDVSFSLCDYGTDLPAAHMLTKEIVRNFDGVIHFAALSGIAACEEDPWRAINDNVMSAGKVFEICSELGIPVVFTSSQAAKDPQSSMYANVKHTCENLANYFNRYGGKNYVVRLANVYGGYKYLKKKQTCIKQFVTNYAIGKNFIIHGDGKQERDFVNVYDVCEAIYRLLTIQPDYFKPIDIGTGIGHTIMNVVDMFPPHVFEFTCSRSAGAQSSVANTYILEKLTGFKPERKLEDYIKEMSRK